MKVISTATVISNAFRNAGRASEILGVFAQHGFADLVHRIKLSSFLPKRYSQKVEYQSHPVAERLRMTFEKLGPTFVKLGQLLATRPDLIPLDFIEEFEKLQDNVPSVPFDSIRSFVEGEYGKNLEDVFDEIDKEPIAAASIAQVHSARLKTGETIALKIQRPGIAKLIQNDIAILRGFAVLLERYVPESKLINPTGLVEEFFNSILYETDFLVEANNIRRIQKNLSVLPKIVIPKVYSEWTTHKVLALEKFEGIRFSDREAVIAAGIDPMDIVEIGSDAFFRMVMYDGLFHADLHAGNLFVLRDGKIGLIDFGIVGRLSRRVQDSIISIFIALVEEDYETLASEYLDLCQSTGETNVSELQKDLMDMISPYIGMALGEVNIGRVLLNSTSVAARHHLKVPRELMLLFKAIVSIEALGKKLEPNFDILQVGTRQARQVLTARYTRDRIVRDLLVIGRDVQVLVERFPRLLKGFLRTWSQNGYAFETRSKDTAALASAMRSFTYQMLVTASAVILSAMGITFWVTQTGPLILGGPVLGWICFVASLTLLLASIWSTRSK